MQKNDTRTRDVYVRTSLRLRRALGLVGVSLASIGSGPCGACPDSYTHCHTLEELEAWHDKYLVEFEESCVNGGAGASGEAGVSGEAGAPGASSRLVSCYPWYHDSISAWDPSAGCPTNEQVEALDEEHRWATGSDLPTADENETKPICCHTVHPYCPGGRPFVVEGRARLPELAGELPTHTSSSLSAALAQTWAEDGLAEHASVAAFARLTLQLMAFGAPSQLIEASQRASLDELRHAEFCFAEATRHADRRIEPGPLDIGQACASLGFEDFMVLNLIEGCVGETLAALRMAEQARLAESPALTRALSEISEDETRHAELAFEILRFGLAVNRPATLAALRRVLEMRFDDDITDPRGPIPEPVWEAHGRLSAKTRRQVDRDAWNLVLAPLLQGLLSDASLQPSTPEREH